MSALRTALLEWDANRVSRVLVASAAVVLAKRVTDDLFVGLLLVVLFAALLDVPWVMWKRYARRSGRSS